MKRRGAYTALRKQDERGASCFVESGERNSGVKFFLLGIISFHCSPLQGKQALFHTKIVYEPLIDTLSGVLCCIFLS